MLGRLNLDAEADEALRRAVALAPDSSEAWVSLVAHLARLGRRDEGQRLLAQVEQKVPAGQRNLTLGRCYEALGQIDAAEKEYRLALKRTPEVVSLRKRLAAFLLRTDQPAKAAVVLAELTQPRAWLAEEELPEVRRQLALVRAETDGAAAVDEALALLAQNRGTLADRRVRVLVEAARPESRAEALRTLEGLVTGAELRPEERLYLARLYETDGQAARARGQYLLLLEQDRDNPAYMMAYIEGLLRQNNRGEARLWLERLEMIAPDSEKTRALRQRHGS
jgi:tetratricopeptide (TPR) repeat protein